MAKCRVVLSFPPEKAENPLAYHLVKDFDLKINILRAKVDPNEEGKLLLEIENHEWKNIDKGIEFLREQGIMVELVEREIQWNESECIHCGACTAVCGSGALTMGTEDWRLRFDKQKCMVCGLCVNACPMNVIKVEF